MLEPKFRSMGVSSLIDTIRSPEKSKGSMTTSRVSANDAAYFSNVSPRLNKKRGLNSRPFELDQSHFRTESLKSHEDSSLIERYGLLEQNLKREVVSGNQTKRRSYGETAWASQTERKEGTLEGKRPEGVYKDRIVK